MDMREDWLRGLWSWASANGSVRELWLFGSRASGHSRVASDVDLAVSLLPPIGDHNWALGNYLALGDEWQQQLEEIVGHHVSLEAIGADTKENLEARGSWVLLWSRETGDSQHD